MTLEIKNYRTLEETLSILKKCIVRDGGIFDLGWCEEFLYAFYNHFGDENRVLKAGSLIGFWGLLCEWEDDSSFPFYTGVEEFESHHFDKYATAFIQVKSELKEDLPNIFFVIVESLKLLDKRDGFENDLLNLSNSLFSNIRKELFSDCLEWQYIFVCKKIFNIHHVVY
ncbi:hypothetical protein ACTWP4_19130 [Gracilibacillus sp. D59]|uniref:hypothetical protein n=1 Tax=Gracilibacillus sp. D59 TaxID=3457434 RepID=UPI003FCC6F38